MPDNDVTRMTISDGGVRRAVLEVANNGQVVAVYDSDGLLLLSRDIPEWVRREIRKRGLTNVNAPTEGASSPGVARITISSGGALRAVLEVANDRKVVAVLDGDGLAMPSRSIPEWVWREIRKRGLFYARDDALDHASAGGLGRQRNLTASSEGGANRPLLAGAAPIVVAVGLVAVVVGLAIVALISRGSDPVEVAATTPTPTPVWFGVSVREDSAYGEGLEWRVESFQRRSDDRVRLTVQSDGAEIPGTGWGLEGVTGRSYEGRIVDETDRKVTISFYVLPWEAGLRVARRGEAIPLELLPPPDPAIANAVFTPDQILRGFRADPGRAGRRFIIGGPITVEGVVNNIGDSPVEFTPDNPAEAAALESVRGLRITADALGDAYGRIPPVYLSQTPQQVENTRDSDDRDYRIFFVREHPDHRSLSQGDAIRIRCVISIERAIFTGDEVVCTPA